MADLTIPSADDIATQRGQRVCVLRRHGQYWLGGSSWSDRVELAKMFPADQMESRARIDIGMPCEMLYVAPRIIDGAPVHIVGEAKVKRK